MNLLKKLSLITLLLLLQFNVSFAQKRTLALTIDDLPFVGESQNFHLNMIINTLKSNEIPATGFIIAGEVTNRNWPMLRKFREAGFGLGNHTMTHKSLNKIATNAYIQEIDEADKILSPLMTEPKYFRYPYLTMGTGNKKDKVLDYLSIKNYHVAPVTIDSRDFVFNQLLLGVAEPERRHFLTLLKPCYLDYIWQQTLKAEEHNQLAHKPDQPQILLIHANLLNAYVLPDIIQLYREKGYQFVKLSDALNHDETSLATLHSKNDWIDPGDLAWD